MDGALVYTVDTAEGAAPSRTAVVPFVNAVVKYLHTSDKIRTLLDDGARKINVSNSL